MDNHQRGDGPDRGRGSGNQGPGNNRNHSSLLIFLVVTLVTLVVMSFVNNMVKDSTSQEITYDEFLEMLSAGNVERVELETNKVTITPKNQPFSSQGVSLTFYTGRTDDPDLVRRLEEAKVKFQEEIPDTTTNLILNVVLSFAPLILIWRRDAAHGERGRRHGRGQEPRQDVYAEGNRRHLQGCCRAG